MGVKSIFCILAMLLLAPFLANAATIYGNVYDIELNSVNTAIVEISTSPKQVLVSKNGTYSFEVPQGMYTLSAKSNGFRIAEQITVKSAGIYVLDLILFDDMSLDEALLNETAIEFTSEYFEQPPLWNYLIGILILIVVGIYGVRFMLQQKKETPKNEVFGDLKKIVGFIKKKGGRTTQKEIRKQFPESEAKISLMIADLESKGMIKKIKKGRGNIIILK